MKLELIRNSDDRIVGYKLIKEESDDTASFEAIRDMHFFGVNDNVIKYHGRTSDITDATTELKFATKAHCKIELDKINSPII